MRSWRRHLARAFFPGAPRRPRGPAGAGDTGPGRGTSHTTSAAVAQRRPLPVRGRGPERGAHWLSGPSPRPSPGPGALRRQDPPPLSACSPNPGAPVGGRPGARCPTRLPYSSRPSPAVPRPRGGHFSLGPGSNAGVEMNLRWRRLSFPRSVGPKALAQSRGDVFRGGRFTLGTRRGAQLEGLGIREPGKSPRLKSSGRRAHHGVGE